MGAHLVIGASGQVGEHLLADLGDDGAGTYFENAVEGLRRLDARDERAVTALLDELEPEVVYLPASEPNVDLCEREPEATAAVNVGVVETVARAVAGRARIVFFSTDYVFDGSAGPYREDDEPRPLSEYGRQKLAGERIALGTPGGLVIRTAVVYGWERQRKNFVVRLIAADAEGGAHWRVPSDQVGSPTYAPNLAASVVELARGGATGVFHVAGPRAADRYTFAREATSVFGLDDVLVSPVETHELAQAAQRPLSAALDVSKAQSVLHTRLVPYDEGLRLMAQAK